MPDSNWLLVSEYKTEHDLHELTAKQWAKYRRDNKLMVKNIGGKYYVTDQVEDIYAATEQEEVVNESPAVRPSVVTFGDFSHNLTVVNNAPVHSSINPIQNNGVTGDELAATTGTYKNQLDAFTAFLDNADRMLEERKRVLDEQAKLRRELLQDTQLKVETLRQKALRAQRETVAYTVNSEADLEALAKEQDAGKSLVGVYAGLQL